MISRQTASTEFKMTCRFLYLLTGTLTVLTAVTSVFRTGGR